MIDDTNVVPETTEEVVAEEVEGTPEVEVAEEEAAADAA
jgi:hypothetical protein